MSENINNFLDDEEHFAMHPNDYSVKQSIEIVESSKDRKVTNVDHLSDNEQEILKEIVRC